MIRDTPHVAKIVGTAACSLIAFAAGAAAATIMAGDVARGEPIIKPNAWEQQAVQPIAQTVFAERAPAQRNPWDVSEVAMEEILLEMQQRGWRAPNQGNAVELLDPEGELSIVALYPDAPMPGRRGGGASMIITGEDAIAEFPMEDAELLTAPVGSEPDMPSN